MSDFLYVSCPAMVHRVAVIGSGSSGLACTKACVDQGLEPVCFEKSHDIGGLWNFKVSGDETRFGWWERTLQILNISACLFNFKKQTTQEESDNFDNQIWCVYIHFKNNIVNNNNDKKPWFACFKVPLEEIHCCFPYFVLQVVFCLVFITCRDKIQIFQVL